ncbi:MAG: leucyl/phenylalanyl-tRNA--protein transferase, partial [Acidimicrobiia bacterium]|nr:leucyl/phenylalanyl-tRNA--protein transferase [Acidimicrobiia bacterium]
MPADIPTTSWIFPPVDDADEHGVVGIGADLEPGTLLAAYASGLFPMPFGPSGPIAWWSPDPRGILEPAAFRPSRSLRRSMRRYDVTIDAAFDRVIDACRSLPRPGGWINTAMRDAYVHLHSLGWAHSIETWREGELVGGLYGVAIGGLFAGESMFHLATDASKVALATLVEQVDDGCPRL